MFAEDLYGQYPLGLDAIDQVCPGNFSGYYKAPAEDLVSGVYMGVQEEEDDE